ncbi:related to non-ribosomal peptide synthetase [Phialocephala subalpina]|uniref:Related to non-ribosomal peptide synthetase n=1 Tax=Phialocephala subalpina TaxID=576137 RepID=A0A1L7WV68_9HELO|nr:related to non-ribosomal peptide synthetase [Phialocephala subalpina]
MEGNFKIHNRLALDASLSPGLVFTPGSPLHLNLLTHYSHDTPTTITRTIEVNNQPREVTENFESLDMTTATEGATEACTTEASSTSLDHQSSSDTLIASPPSTFHETEKPPLQITHVLPPEKVDQRPFRQFRHVVFTVYRRLFTVVIIANIIALILIDISPQDTRFYFKAISSAASANLFVTIAIRQDYVINFLFDIFASGPKSGSLHIRRILTKVFEAGGVHSSAGICALAWFVRLAIFLTLSFENGSVRNVPILALTYVLLLLITGIVIFAHPKLRSKTHNTFERMHRFGGWLSSATFWTLIVLTAKYLANLSGSEQSTIEVLIHFPSFWLLTLNTIHAIVPWLRLRKLEAWPERLSDHALRLHLKANIGSFYTVRISDSPLSEWHSFACFIDSKPKNGSTNSVVISRAGDWTAKTIAEPKPYYWIRGLPTRGVLYMSLMFRSIVLVTTGSGIGPCLNLLFMDPSTRPTVRVLWSTPKPLATFGEEILGNVREADPAAVIWDTKRFGRPDMVALTWQLLMESQAEAVFVISNPKVTKMVVYALESRGVAAYGPIFDS